MPNFVSPGSTRSLVRRGSARSREQAVELIVAGRVEVRGVIARKPATSVADGVSVNAVISYAHDVCRAGDRVEQHAGHEQRELVARTRGQPPSTERVMSTTMPSTNTLLTVPTPGVITHL